MLIKQELHCHGCNQYVQFEVDINQDGNYTIPCPKCGTVAQVTCWTTIFATSLGGNQWQYYGSTGIATTTAC